MAKYILVELVKVFAAEILEKVPEPAHDQISALEAPLILAINHLFEAEIFSKEANPLKGFAAIWDAIEDDPVTLTILLSEP